MLNKIQFIVHVIRPAVEHLGAGGKAAEQLLMGTALQESRLHYLHQIGGGPAKGVFQMEPATYNDIWANYLKYKPELASKVAQLSGPAGGTAEEMCGNMLYAAALCRVHYLRVPAALPAAGDLEAQADYWKQFYNTYQGAGTVEEYIENYQEAMFRLDWP